MPKVKISGDSLWDIEIEEVHKILDLVSYFKIWQKV
jgi:hypothetical protein